MAEESTAPASETRPPSAATPTVFLSAATLDLKAWRDHLDEAFRRAGFRVLTQDQSLRSAPGDVRRLLVETVDEADCVIHLAGMAYGSDATAPFPSEPGFRCSWTQFEYYHAHERKKDVIAFVCAPSLSAAFTEKADSPDDLARKQKSQEAHRERVANGTFTGTPLEQFTAADGTPLRTSNEAVPNPGKLLSAVAAAVGTLHNIAREHRDAAQRGLQDMAATLAGVEKDTRWLRKAALITLVVLGIVGGCIGWLMRQGEQTQRQVTATGAVVNDLKNVNAKERKLMALILARANERIKEWERMTPGQRFDLALDQIAAEQAVPAKGLRDLLDLYVARVEADPDAEADDKYFVLMRKRAYTEAAALAGKEGESAEARMKPRLARRDAAKAVMQKEAEEVAAERKNAIDFYQKKGAALIAAVKFQDSLLAYQKAAALVDKTADPIGWANAQENVTFVDLLLARYQHAEPLMKEIVRLREEHHGPDDPTLATALNNLAQLYKATNRLAEAQQLQERALTIAQKHYGPEHPEIAPLVNNLAQLYRAHAQFAKAEPLFMRALKIWEISRGEESPEVGIVANNLGLLYQDTDRLAEAEPFQKRALMIAERDNKSPDPEIARCLDNLALLYQRLGRLAEAKELHERALNIFETSCGPDHPDVALCLNNLGQLYKKMNRLPEAELFLQRGLKILEKNFELRHPDAAAILSNLALLYQATDRALEAEALLLRALEISEKILGPDHPQVATALVTLALSYQKTKRFSEAEPLLQRALKIDEKIFGLEHPHVARDIEHLVEFYRDADRFAEAEALIERGLMLAEKRYGSDDPRVIVHLYLLALLYSSTDRLAESEPLLQRVSRIAEKSYGSEHPKFAIHLYNRALQYMRSDRLTEAEPILRRAVVILLKSKRAAAELVPDSFVYLHNYGILLEKTPLSKAEITQRLAAAGREAGYTDGEFRALLAPMFGPFDVAVTEVVPEGQGPGLGIRVGDVVRRYNGQEITKLADLVKLTGESKGDAIPLEIQRGTETLKLTAKPGRLGLALEDRPMPAAK